MIRLSSLTLLVGALGMAAISAPAFAFDFSGVGFCGRKEPWSGACWNDARFKAQNACLASGCKKCTVNSHAALDKDTAPCDFGVTTPGRYTCFSTCQDAPACATPPTVSVSATPTSIWPPNKKMVAVTLSGTVTNAPGCTLSAASYALADEYGANQAGPLIVGDNGSFSVTVYVQAWRNGTDKDGRSYSFSASATNQSGAGTSNEAVSTVPHSQRR
ncbi:MAG: hypothetical protein HY553_17170 [Elusimicrobia bacterium]|nr:hypothetical protein [Elusimicrobiota bacterium]